MDLSWLHQFWNQVRNAPMDAQIFTIGAVVVWALVARSAWRRAQLHTAALVLATVYCFIGEYLAIRLGKYHYEVFALSMPEFQVPGLAQLFGWLSRIGVIPQILDAPGASKHVPVEVALLEGALLFSVFRITNLLSPQRPLGEYSSSASLVSWLRPRWANPVFNGFLALSLDAMLDPIVSGTMSLDSGATQPGLGLWIWHTNAHYAGHWFGIPLANYNAWFAALFAFTIATRVGTDHLSVGGTRLHRGKVALGTGLRSVGKLVGLLFLLKFSLDYLTYEMFGLLGSPTPRVWQFAIIGALVVAGIVAGCVIARRALRDSAFEWVTVLPIAFTFAYCAGALLFARVDKRIDWLVILWVVTGSIALLHAWAPWREREQAAQQPVAAL